jgi:hypothetical protein
MVLLNFEHHIRPPRKFKSTISDLFLESSGYDALELSVKRSDMGLLKFLEGRILLS